MNTLKNDLRRVVVSGMGIVSCLGDNVNLVWNNLLNHKSGIFQLEDKEYNLIPSKIAGRVMKFEDLETNKDILSKLTPHWRSATRPSFFALIATEEAINQAKLDFRAHDINAGVCIGTSMVCLNEIIETNDKFKSSYNKISPYFIPKILYNMPAGLISIKYAINGLNHCVSTACATGLHAVGDAFRFIKYGDADLIICGATESCINPLALAGFSRMKALSTSFNSQPEKASRPFDKDRDGFVMSEGAGILVLEELEHAKKRGVTPICEILGYGLSADAMHVTSPSSNGVGAEKCMRKAIKDANLNIKDIGYINAHATSTPIGDLIEATAIARLFSQCKINLSSTKGATGHMLGAAGAAEIIFTAMACQNAILPPCTNLDIIDPQILHSINSLPNSYAHFPIYSSNRNDNKKLNDIEDESNYSFLNKECSLTNVLNFVNEMGGEPWISSERRVALTNSFGFGGTNACICVGQYVD